METIPAVPSRTLNPALIKPLKGKLLVTPYKRPERVGSILLPDTARDNIPQNLWHFVTASDETLAMLDYPLERDDIIRSNAMAGVYGFTFQNEHYYFLHHTQIRAVIPLT